MTTPDSQSKPISPPRWSVRLRNTFALFLGGAVLTTPSLVIAEKAPATPRVAILSAKDAPNHFDEALKKLGWSHEKFEDSDSGWTSLEKKTDKFDLIITTPGLENFFPRADKSGEESTKAKVEALRNFAENGGGIIQTGAITPAQLEWLPLLNEKLGISTELPKNVPAKAAVHQARHPHQLYTYPREVTHSTKGNISFYKTANNNEWEQIATYINPGQSCFLLHRIGKGFVALSTLTHDDTALLENAALLLRLQRSGLAFHSVRYSFDQTTTRDEIVQGSGNAELNFLNTSKEPISITGVLRASNKTLSREVRAISAPIEPKKFGKLVYPISLDLCGKTKIQVALDDPLKGGEITFSERELDLPEFLTVIPPAYRGLLSTARRDKNVHFQIRFAPIPENIEGIALQLTVIGPDKKTVSEKELIVSARKFPVVMDLPADAPEGEYRIVAKGLRQGVLPIEAETTFKIIPVRPGQVVVDQDTVLLKEGKPFFPLGMYHVTDEQIDDVADLGVNLVQFWNWYTNPESMKKLQNKGIQVLWEGHAWGVGVHLNPHKAMEHERFRKELQEQRDIAAKYKTHPALTMWYVADEPSPSRLPLLHHINNTWHEVDEDHPTYLVATGEYAQLQAATDVLGIDVYPIYRGRRNPLSIISKATDDAMKGVNYRKPVIAIPQSFGNNKQHGEKPEEVRAMTYLFVTHGVKGVIWYCWKETGDKTGEEGAGHHPETQKVLKELISELKVVSPALMEPGARQLRSADGKVHAILCGSDTTGRYLLYVNEAETPVKTALDLPELEGKKLEGLFGTKANTVRNGKVELDLPPIATGVFQIK